MPDIPIIECHFSPWEKITPFIVQRISEASNTIHGSLFGIENIDITYTLIQAVKRNVSVHLGLDLSQSKLPNSTHLILIQQGVMITIKKLPELEHNKYLIIDGQVVLEGSFNYSNIAQTEDNTFLIIESESIAEQFETDFQRIIQRDS